MMARPRIRGRGYGVGTLTEPSHVIRLTALRLSCHTQYSVSGPFAKPEAQTLEVVDQGGQRRHQSAAFGVQQDPERPRQRDPKNLGVAPCQRIVQDHDRIGPFQGQKQDAGFSGTEIRDQAHDPLARWGAQVDPRQRFRDGKIEAAAPALGQLLGNGGWDRDPRDQLRQQLQMPDLVKVLERRGIADNVRQGMSVAPARLR